MVYKRKYTKELLIYFTSSFSPNQNELQASLFIAKKKTKQPKTGRHCKSVWLRAVCPRLERETSQVLKDYSRVNEMQYSVIIYMRKESEKEWIYVYVSLNFYVYTWNTTLLLDYTPNKILKKRIRDWRLNTDNGSLQEESRFRKLSSIEFYLNIRHRLLKGCFVSLGQTVTYTSSI